jgi:ABC-type transport system involved in multi-copper enzyme maturation permease subunit
MTGGELGGPLGGWAAARLQGAWTARRLLRGRMLWVAAFFALAPIALAVLLVQAGHQVKWEDLFGPIAVLCGIVPPLFTASTVAEEFEDRTYTYLWSRPLPRWSVLVGKLLATVPIAAVLLAVTALLCYQLALRGEPAATPWPAAAAGKAVLAVSMAALTLSMVSGGIAVLMPRHGIAVAYAYLLVLDVPLGLMPFSISKLSLTHHVGTLGGLRDGSPDASPTAAAIWLLGIGTFWLVLGLWRIGRSEFASSEK